ncbi:MAG: T9SS type A sorting domain-containing protein [Salinivirgaceae bacterium]|jgi:hypothetical protein|nr:T9SS type A sorting domain-containing protein [Salinivirgaceae bacterium]
MRRNLPLRKITLSLLSLICFGGLTFAQITTPPTVDGDGTDAAWDAAPAWKIESVISAEDITDANDFSGTVKVLWSADSLYYKVEVLDDVTYQGAGAAYSYDNVAIYLDAYNKATSNYSDSTIANWEKFWAVEDHFGGRTGGDWNPTTANWAVNVDTNKMYTIELAVAFAEFGKTAQVSDVLGFDIKLSDSDGEDTPRDQLAFRDVSDMGWDKPAVFGEITLKANGTAVSNKMFVPTIDGAGTERAWATASVNEITSVISMTNNTDAADFSGNFKLVWDKENLYALISVKDDSLYSGAAAVYENDNVNIHIDGSNSKPSVYGDDQFAYSKDWWTDDSDMRGDGKPGTWVTTINEGSDYTIEIAIPFSNAANFTTVSPTIGDILGFDVILADNDGEGRDLLGWMDITDMAWSDPSVFGEIALGADGSVEALSSRPTAPSGLEAVVGEAGLVTLSWSEAADMTYNLYRDGNLVVDGLEVVTYVDTVTANGTYVYTLRVADADGVLSNESGEAIAVVDNIISIDAKVADFTKVYPNPAYNELKVASAEDIQRVNVISLSGAIVKSVEVNSNFVSLKIGDLDAGVYMVNVQFEGQVANYRVVIK